MDWDLLTPEERELRSLIWIEEREDGAVVGHERDPERAAELRRIIEARESDGPEPPTS